MEREKRKWEVWPTPSHWTYELLIVAFHQLWNPVPLPLPRDISTPLVGPNHCYATPEPMMPENQKEFTRKWRVEIRELQFTGDADLCFRPFILFLQCLLMGWRTWLVRETGLGWALRKGSVGYAPPPSFISIVVPLLVFHNPETLVSSHTITVHVTHS